MIACVAALKWTLRALDWCVTSALRVAVLLVSLASVITLGALTWLLSQMASLSRASAARDSATPPPAAARRASDGAAQKPPASGSWWL